MNRRTQLESLLDRVRRKPLDPAEIALIRPDESSPPATRNPLEEEQELTRLLGRLPAAPSSPDFTRQLIQRLEQEPVAQPGLYEAFCAWFRQGWLNPRQAAALTLLLFVPVFWWSYRPAADERLADSLARVTRPVTHAGLVTQLPPVTVLQDFDVIDQIRRLSSLADEDLLASLEWSHP
jgi:hypothetical protein